MAFATGRFVRYGYFAHGFEEEDVVGMVRMNFKRRLKMYDGDMELAPGFSLHLAAGHTAGLQVARVHTQRGYVVLASDSSHYYENIQKSRAFVAVVNIADTLDSFLKVERLAGSPRHIIPGHDPLVMQRYPPASTALKDVVVRLDADPAE